jgi:hypothetical protein
MSILCRIRNEACPDDFGLGWNRFCAVYGGSGVFIPVGEVSGEVFFFGKCMENGKC